MSSFKCHSPNDFFFLNFICFHVLHNVGHKISIIFMMLKTFSCADLFSRPLCWNMYWWIMWFLCGFEYIAKITTGYISRRWLEFVLAVREMSGRKVREFFSANPVATLLPFLTMNCVDCCRELLVTDLLSGIQPMFLKHISFGFSVSCQIKPTDQCQEQCVFFHSENVLVQKRKIDD